MMNHHSQRNMLQRICKGSFNFLIWYCVLYLWETGTGLSAPVSVYGNLILPFLTIHGICVYNWVRDILSQMTLCHQEEYDCIIQKRARSWIHAYTTVYETKGREEAGNT